MLSHVPGRPRIGITLEFDDPQVAQVEQRVRRAIEGAGGLAVIVPPSDDPASWQAAYERLDGIALMGGGDVDPAHYGAEPHPLTVPAPSGADVTDLGLARAALADGRPILGVCRGSQVLAVAGGGSLIQDVPSLVGHEVPHSHEWRAVSQAPDEHRHRVRVERGTRVAALLADADAVNSYHHQAVERPGAEMRAVAHAQDGVIEAIEGTNGAFVLGLQWHEEFHIGDPRLTAVFAALVAAASRTEGHLYP
ncbi:MAG: putative glutamine amidotransferase [Gaiellales bacterium]|jgi:putative glutamine amidotransferase|nr:putative glutamine amidotransferase [Gaiellales bacterium]